ncbi:hypothetical protein HMPREF1982_01337 [Clostridiales bacterium oral taxon 876 str. F0540]|nr:hypothetical protein HMPREF1982_01337 [Clostridiales bacterium oral taxon 876 str. F0540]
MNTTQKILYIFQSCKTLLWIVTAKSAGGITSFPSRNGCQNTVYLKYEVCKVFQAVFPFWELRFYLKAMLKTSVENEYTLYIHIYPYCI